VDTTSWVSEGRTTAILPFSKRRRRAVPVQTWALLGCAFVLGFALAAVAFVGIWKNTARQSDQARAAKAATAHRLDAAVGRAGVLDARLRATRSELARVRQQSRLSRAALAAANTALAKAKARIATAARAAGVIRANAPLLAQQTSTLTSDLAALQGYLAKTPPSSIDPGFLQTQLRYIANAASRLGETTATLEHAAG
jgi:septal ring factor EnvC (AmiA/AmiB activator)